MHSPLFVCNMLMIYATRRPLSPPSVSRTAVVEQAERDGLITPNNADRSEYDTTPKGLAWVNHVLSTPLPIEHWAIPEREQ